MNRSESKYFSTAVRMDEALLELLEKKDFSYITVKEICEAAGVNRSTFYLHYETLADLLEESTTYIIRHFEASMPITTTDFLEKIRTAPLDELYLITPEYLVPYLNYVREHRRVFRTAQKQASVLKMDDAYSALNRHVFAPILDRFHVAVSDRKYMIAFYINGLMAIIGAWLEEDCKDSVDHLVSVMQSCIGNIGFMG